MPFSPSKIAFLATFVIACNRPDTAAVGAPRVVTDPQAHATNGSSRQFGSPIEATAAPARLAEILATPQQFESRPMRIEGQVVAVCQEMGCWMEIRDNNTQAHIRMHGHSFFVPREVSGHRAAVEATLVAAHPATHCDQEANAATGRVAQVELDATGVQLLD